MRPLIRKIALTAHILFSVGWLGSIVPYLALALAGLTSQEDHLTRSLYGSMELIAWWVIAPLSVAAFLSGLIQALGTPWGLFRHWWILVKLVLTTGAVIILFAHLPTVSRVAQSAATMTLSGDEFRALQLQLVVHASGGLLVLVAATALSVFKPWGLTPYGRRLAARCEPPHHRREHTIVERENASPRTTPLWLRIMGIHVVGLIMLGVVVHLAAGGLQHH